MTINYAFEAQFPQIAEVLRVWVRVMPSGYERIMATVRNHDGTPPRKQTAAVLERLNPFHNGSLNQLGRAVAKQVEAA